MVVIYNVKSFNQALDTYSKANETLKNTFTRISFLQSHIKNDLLDTLSIDIHSSNTKTLQSSTRNILKEFIGTNKLINNTLGEIKQTIKVIEKAQYLFEKIDEVITHIGNATIKSPDTHETTDYWKTHKDALQNVPLISYNKLGDSVSYRQAMQDWINQTESCISALINEGILPEEEFETE